METNVIFHLGFFPVTDNILFTWIIIAFLAIASFLLTRNLKTVPRGLQHLVELTVDGIESMVVDNIGPKGKPFVPLIMTIGLYVLVGNLISLIPGAISPTGNLNTAVALALVVFFVSHTADIYHNGIKAYIKNYFTPFWFIFPLNIIGEISKVLSHSFRLYGNIYGGGIILSILYMFVPYVIPVPILLWFGVFMGAIQAFVFTLLAITYIQIRFE